MPKERLDKLILQQGLAASRQKAQALILAGQVIVDDHRLDKVGARIETSADIRLKGEALPYVSRGGLKLEKALADFHLSVKGRVALDVGASTGGFTDCLLQHGVLKVFAVDVGYGQLAWSLREDSRVVNLERCNIRQLRPEDLPAQPDLAVIDASFISLTKVLPPTLELLAAEADIIALIKPQFEVGRGQVGKKGVVKDSQLQSRAVEAVCAAAQQLQCRILGVIDSPILGQKGNREFLLHLRKWSGSS